RPQCYWFCIFLGAWSTGQPTTAATLALFMVVCSLSACGINRAFQSVLNCPLADGYFSRCFIGQLSVRQQSYGCAGPPAHSGSKETALASDCPSLDFDSSGVSQLEFTPSAANVCLLSPKK